MMGGVGELPTHITSEAELEHISRELRENGVKVNTDARGLLILKRLGVEVEMSKNVGRARFVVSERSSQPFGVLHGGVTGLVAESIVSITGQYAANGQEIQGVELNANHLRAVPIGEEVFVIAKPVMKGGRIQVWEVKFETLVKKKNGLSERAVTAICRVTLLVGSAVEPSNPESNPKTPPVQSKL